ETFPGQKLFSCHVCSNSFSTKGSLKVHMRLHTGAKPFKCPHCDLRFRTSGRRKTHIQCHYKQETKKVRKPVARTSAEGLQPVSLLNSSSTDPNVFIMNNPVVTSQFDQNLLPQGLVGQAILPASMSDGSLATLEGIQLQLAANLVGQNVQISGIDATSINNITLQIDPSILQQTLQQSNLLAQHLTGDPSMGPQNPSLQATENAVPANVVIQPISGLSLQPTVTSSTNMTIGSLSEQESVLTTSASGPQDISQVMTSQGMVSSSNGQHEIMLTINNSSLSHVLAHASCSTTTNSSGSPQEITLTISGQDLIPHNPGSSDLSSGLRLTAPTINSQTTSATLTISNDQLLSQGTSLNAPELTTTGGTNLPSATPISQSTVSAQNLVMSSSGVGDGSVTLTLADTQGMLSGGLDAVTLNITSQGQPFPAILTDSSLASQSGSGPQQVILVSHTPHSASANSDEITYQVTEVSPNVAKSSQAEKEGRVHQCFECSQTFSSATMLMHHSKEVHGKERIHVCHVCNKAFKRATHLKEHMQTHQAGPSLSSQKPRVFKCDSCEKAFAKPSQLERHSRIHTGERPFQCTLCEKAFNQKSALQVHMKKHTGERPYKCDYCAMGFTQKSNMKLHMKRAHGYIGPVQESVSQQDQDGEDISRALNLEEVVQESSNEWQSIGNVFR
ncbi:ZN236 protein, partial [Bucorvus abyssinicus]|nr:ZN236 protein [Bucorvus abyssinicus]